MALVLRLDKGSSLDFTELDGNFTYLDGRIDTTNTTITNVSSSAATDIANISSSLSLLSGSFRTVSSSFAAVSQSFNTVSSSFSLVSESYSQTSQSIESLSNRVITTGSASLRQSITGSLIVSSSLKVTGSLSVSDTITINGSQATNFIVTPSIRSSNIYPLEYTNQWNTNDGTYVQIPSFPYLQGSFQSSQQGGGVSTIYGYLKIGNEYYDDTNFFEYLRAQSIWRDNVSSGTPGSPTFYPKPVFRTIITDNSTVLEGADANATIGNLVTANGRKHVLTVTGSFLCLDGVSIGSSWTDRHIVTGSLRAANITGSLFGSASYSLTASYALNGGGSSLTSFIATGSVSASVDVGISSFQIISGSNTFLSINNLGGTIISGSLTVVSGSTEFQVLDTGVKIGNSSADNHIVTGSLSTLGNAGINTTASSNWNLDVAGSTGKFRVGNSNFSDIFTVGVGSGNQGYSDIYLNGQSYGLALYSNPQTGNGYVVTANTQVGAISYSTASVGLIAGGNSSALVFGTQGTEKMRIHTTGDVSIGTQANNITGSGYRLNVTGSGVSGSFRVNNVLFVSSSTATITGSLRVSAGITGSLQGTASWANNAVSANNGGVTSIGNGTGISISSATGEVTVTNSLPRIGPTYDQLLYVFSQTGSSDPGVPSSPGTPIFDRWIVNTTGRTFTFERVGAGIYNLIADGAATVFLEDTTAIYLTPGQAINSDFACSYEWIDTSKIVIYSTLKDGTQSDDIFKNATLDIRIY